MTVIDHHSMIGDSNCTNSTFAVVKCACAAAEVAAAAAEVVVLVGLQRDRRLEHVAILSSLLPNQGVRCLIKKKKTSVTSRDKCFTIAAFQ